MPSRDGRRRRVERKERRFQRDMSAASEVHRFVVGAPEVGQRLDAFLAAKLAWRSREGVKQLIEDGIVRVLEGEEGPEDPRRLRPSLRLSRLQEVVLTLDTRERLGPAEGDVASSEPEERGFAVVCEDRDLLVVNKAPGVSLYPNQQHLAGSLIERVHRWVRTCRQPATHAGDGEVAAVQPIARLDGSWHPNWMPSPCHRLDRETSGLVVFAKSPEARRHVGQQFEDRTLRKVYLAVVRGCPAEPAGEIDAPLGPAPTGEVRLRVAVLPDGEGKTAVTRWQVRRALGGRSLVELEPKTGRQHQLRAHLAHLGHPILGDKLYLGGDDVFLRALEGMETEADRRLLGLERQALHAYSLTLRHPRDDHAVTLVAPLWLDMVEACRETPESCPDLTGSPVS